MITASAAGAASLIISYMALKALNSFNIGIGNSIVKSLFGNEIIYVRFSFTVAVICTLLSIITVWAAAFIPVRKALKIEPSAAMRAS